MQPSKSSRSKTSTKRNVEGGALPWITPAQGENFFGTDSMSCRSQSQRSDRHLGSRCSREQEHCVVLKRDATETSTTRQRIIEEKERRDPGTLLRNSRSQGVQVDESTCVDSVSAVQRIHTSFLSPVSLGPKHQER